MFKNRWNLRMDKVLIALLVVGLLAFMIVSAGCSTSGIDINEKFDAEGNLTERRVKTGGDIAAMQLALEMKQARASVLEAASWMDADAQNTMMIRGDLWTDEMAAYIRGEIAEGEQIRSGTTGGIWGLVGLAGVYGAAKTIQNGQDQAGDNYTTGNISVTKSDDPVSGEGGSSGYIGGQSVVIGSGNAGTDRVQLNDNVDKAIHVPLNGDSNFDQVDNGSQGGIIIDDPDGGNSGSLF